MKNIKIILSVILLLSLSFNVIAKEEKEKAVTEVIHVNGNCGTCKKNIEGALHAKGIKKASWDEETKNLTVSYYPSKISNDDIQHKVADAGYDTEKYKATDEAYNKLHTCCKYERK